MDEDQNDFKNALKDTATVIAENMGPGHENMLRTFFSSEMQTCLKMVQEVAGFEMTSNLREPFQKFYSFVTSPEPDAIIKLRNDQKKGDYWYHQLVNGILGNVQQSFTCVLYHQSRLLTVEAELMTRLASLSEIPGLLKNSFLGVGGTQILDFEYQAYVMAYRRCLDQFATAISAFFKDRTNSFRKLPKNLSLKRPPGVVKAIANVHKKHVAAFEFVMSEGGDPSVRDRIAHFEFVPAGTLNIRPDGAILVGGGENLNFFLGVDGEKAMLANVIANKTAALHNCIEELISEFIRSVTIWEDDSIKF